MLTHIPRPAEAIAADRARYEEHQRKGLTAAPSALPAPSPRPAPEATGVLGRLTIPGGWYDVLHLKAGERLRLSPEGLGVSVAIAAWVAADPSERMNLPDTVKVQWTTELRKGRVVLTDMGRVLFSITEDSTGGAHDVLTGGSGAAAPFTPAFRSTRENMVLAVAKLGLDKRDLPALITFFAPIAVDAEGALSWNAANAATGDWVELRAEVDMAVALSATRHPLDPCAAPEVPATQVLRLAARPVAADDPCRTATAEARRAFENNTRI